MKWKALLLVGLLFSHDAWSSVTLPYSFSAGNPIRASETNADLGALRDEINAHESNPNGHNTSLQDVLSVNNSCGLTPIEFNLTEAKDFRVENLGSDPSCSPSALGRLIWNTNDNLFKICNGSSYVSIAGTGVNTLSSVLSAGNSAGSSNINVNNNQLLSARVENLTSDPSAGNAGRLIFNTNSSTLKVDTGSTIQSIGGAQGLSSVLGVSNSAGSTNINFNGNQSIDMLLESLASDPGTTTAGRIYYNTSSLTPKFYNGTSWLSVGNTNTLAQTLALGNSAGTNDVNFNGHQAQNMRLHNLAAPPGTGTSGTIWYDTLSNQVQYETTGSNRTVCTLDDTQTLSNKTISGASNTLSNVPDNALSSNVGLLNSNQTISGIKTFSSAPVISKIKTPAGTILGHTIPDGLADDTFVMANAVQTLAGKTLNAPTLSGNIDFSEFQGVHIRVENLSANPAPGNAGRLFYKTTTGELLYDTGTQWNVLTQGGIPTLTQVLTSGNSTGPYNLDLNYNQLVHARVENVAGLPPNGNTGRLVFNTVDSKFYMDTGAAWTTVAPETLAQTLATGNSAGSNNIDMNNNQLLNARLENLAVDPAAAQIGRIFYNTASKVAKVDTGTVIKDLADTSTAQTLTNKTIDASSNTISNIADANVSSTAAIARSKIAAGTINQVVVNDGTGALSSVAQVPASEGGLGTNASAFTGVVKASTGSFSASAIVDADVSASAAIARSKIANGTINQVVTNDGTGALASVAQVPASEGGTGIDMSASSGLIKVASGTFSASSLVDADVSSSAAISRSKIASGTSNQVIVNDGSGNLSGVSPGSSGNVLVSNGTAWTSGPGGGGGGSSLQWIEDTNAPTPLIEYNNRIYAFQSGLGQKLYTDIDVPNSYQSGNQISLRIKFYDSDNSGTALVQSIATLARTGTDAINSTSNQRTSTNTAVTLGAGTVLIPQLVTLDLTDSTGHINGVAVSAGDTINVQLTRGTDTATSDVKVLVYDAGVKFQ